MNLFELFCKIFIDDEDYQKGLDDAGKKAKSFAKDAGKSIQDFAKKAEKAFATATKIVSAGIGAASTGVGFLIKSAVEEFANYEQLVGGVETLFKESADVVLRYADNAYQTAGLSANEYMETVTSFSASLLQSLGGDTAEAAEKANLAITDMSDNANKMGTDMTLIQNAYRGFAKANYTMLDNLALGYGGTKEEMQRLLDDANALNREQGKYTNYAIESFVDIVDAIHDVQTQLGITGTTAKEAATTIQGSVNAAKGAWHNLLIGVADDNQDFDKLVDTFVESVETAADNIIPRVEKSLDGILKLINTAAKTILPRVIAEISAKLPDLIDTGAEIVLALGEGIVDNLDGILSAAEKVITRVVPKLAKGFADAVPKIAQSCKKIIKELDGVAEMVGGIIITFKSLVTGNWIGAGIGLVITAIGGLRKISAEARKEVYNLTDAEWDMIDAGRDAAESMDTLRQSREKEMHAVDREIDKTKDLWAELQTLTDENGYVEDANRDRADFIIGELNNALDTEYQMNDGIIGQYQQMQDELDTLIQKRHAESLLATAETAYTNAISNNSAMLEAVAAAQKEFDNARENLDKTVKENTFLDDRGQRVYLPQTSNAYAIEEAREQARSALDDLNEAKKNAEENLRDIANYENAYSAISAGNYEDGINYLTSDILYRYQHLKEIKDLNNAEKAELRSGVQEQQRIVNAYRALYKDNVYGVSAELLSEEETKLSEMAALLETATGEAYDCGQNLALGLKNGFEAQSDQFVLSVASTVDDVIRNLQAGASMAGNTNGYLPFSNFNFGERTYGEGGGTSSSSSSRAAESTEVTINVHADTDDLGTAIAAAVQQALDGVLAARGTTYRGGRTANAY